MKKNKQKQLQIPTQSLRASIDVFDETIVASVYGSGTATRKIVSPAEVVEVFVNSGIQHNGHRQVQWLEFGTGVVKMGLRANGDVCVVVVRPQRTTTLMMQIGRRRRQRITVAIPKLVIEAVWRGGRWSSIERVFAFFGRLGAKTQLYVPPIPNTTGGGKICLGSVATSAAEQMSALDYVEQMLFGTLFTDHHLEGPMRPGVKKYRNVWHLLTATRGRGIRGYLKKEESYGSVFK